MFLSRDVYCHRFPYLFSSPPLYSIFGCLSSPFENIFFRFWHFIWHFLFFCDFERLKNSENEQFLKEMDEQEAGTSVTEGLLGKVQYVFAVLWKLLIDQSLK